MALPHMLLRKGMGTPVIEENIEGKHVKFVSFIDLFIVARKFILIFGNYVN